MYLENKYVSFSKKININSIPNYKNIMIKFINIYLETNSNISDAIIYSKYYLYYKTMNCVYDDDDVMNILYDVDSKF